MVVRWVAGPRVVMCIQVWMPPSISLLTCSSLQFLVLLLKVLLLQLKEQGARMWLMVVVKSGLHSLMVVMHDWLMVWDVMPRWCWGQMGLRRCLLALMVWFWSYGRAVTDFFLDLLLLF